MNINVTPDATVFLDDQHLMHLDVACRMISRAYESPIYLVGSCLKRQTWRDVDVRCIMPHEKFAKHFPTAGTGYNVRKRDKLWVLSCISISIMLNRASSLPIDFQFVEETIAEAWNDCSRVLIGQLE